MLRVRMEDKHAYNWKNVDEPFRFPILHGKKITCKNGSYVLSRFAISLFQKGKPRGA